MFLAYRIKRDSKTFKASLGFLQLESELPMLSIFMSFGVCKGGFFLAVGLLLSLAFLDFMFRVIFV